jgi:hypothetical protein
LIYRWLEGHFDVVLPQAIIDEILRVTACEKSQKYQRLRETRLEFVTLLSEQAIWAEPDETQDVAPEDGTDNR